MIRRNGISCMLAVLFMAACAADDPVPVSGSENVATEADLQAQVDVLAARVASGMEEVGIEPGPLSLELTPDDPEPKATCPLTVVEPCIAPVAICSVRCCDGTLFSSAQVCGNCGTWAIGACANHDTRARIRWSCPCAG